MPPMVERPCHGPPAGSEPERDCRLPRTDCPPVHYLVEKNSIAELLNLDTYESGVFEAGGYEWSLCLRPKGHTNSEGEVYMSLYLSIEEPNKLGDGKKVVVKYKFYVVDNNTGEYVTFQEKGKELRAFSRAKTRWGLSKFLSLASFDNPGHVFCKHGQGFVHSSWKKTRGHFKLDANENPHGPPPEVFEALGSMKFPYIYPNPESRPLRAALAVDSGLEADYILAGCGANELIDLFM